MADTLDSIAYIYAQLADYDQSIAHYGRAQEMYRLIGDPEAEASSRLHLGDVQLAAGQPDAARRSWQQALTLLTRVPGADVSEVSARLRTGDPPGDGAGDAGRGAVKLRTPVRELIHLMVPARPSWGAGQGYREFALLRGKRC
jgi:tetratricopeptide (TPR) repeat protein